MVSNEVSGKEEGHKVSRDEMAETMCTHNKMAGVKVYTVPMTKRLQQNVRLRTCLQSHQQTEILIHSSHFCDQKLTEHQSMDTWLSLIMSYFSHMVVCTACCTANSTPEQSSFEQIFLLALHYSYCQSQSSSLATFFYIQTSCLDKFNFVLPRAIRDWKLSVYQT